jgi:hypothetical protein
MRNTLYTILNTTHFVLRIFSILPASYDRQTQSDEWTKAGFYDKAGLDNRTCREHYNLSSILAYLLWNLPRSLSCSLSPVDAFLLFCWERDAHLTCSREIGAYLLVCRGWLKNEKTDENNQKYSIFSEKSTKSTSTFRTNKPNSPIVQLHLTLFIALNYAISACLTKVKFKPNSNPIKAKTNPIAKSPKINVNNYYTNIYNNKTAFRRNIKVPNVTLDVSSPCFPVGGQTQFFTHKF